MIKSMFDNVPGKHFIATALKIFDLIYSKKCVVTQHGYT